MGKKAEVKKTGRGGKYGGRKERGVNLKHFRGQEGQGGCSGRRKCDGAKV